MAGGPYKDRNGSRYMVWSDKKLHPEQPKVREQLRTKKAGEARKRMHRLEELYEIGKHKPWKQKWYENPSLKPFVTDSLLSGDIKDIHSASSITLGKASEKYISHQISRPSGWQTERTQDVYPRVLRSLVRKLGPDRAVKLIESDDIHKVIHKPDHSSHTIKSNKAKLRGFLNYCVDKGWIVKAPKIEAPPPMKTVPKFFYDIQFLKCCWYEIHKVQRNLESMGVTTAAQHQLRYVLSWMVMAGTGMRPDEAIHVRLQDIYGDQILVSGELGSIKTNTQRMVPVLYEAKSAVSVLTDPNYRNRDKALAKTNRLLGIESESTKKRASAELRRAWKATVGKGKRTAYNLRDYFAVRFLTDSEQGNEDYRLLQLRNHLGHTTITTTEKYLKAVPSRLDLNVPNDTDLVKILSDISARITK